MQATNLITLLENLVSDHGEEVEVFVKPPENFEDLKGTIDLEQETVTSATI